MRNVIGLLLMSVVLLCAQGCRRSGDAKRPLLVSQESEFFYAGDLDSSRNPKTVNQVMLDVGRTRAEKEVIRNNLELKSDAHTVALGKAFLEFAKSPSDAGPADQNAQSRSRFLSYLRRIGQFEVYEKMIEKKMDVTFFYDPKNMNHIVAWHSKSNEGGQIAAYRVGSGESTVPMSETDLDNGVRFQELFMVRNYAWGYFQGNPPETRSFEKLYKYVKAIVPSPEIAKVLETKGIRVNLEAKHGNLKDWMLCQAATHTKMDKGGQVIRGPDLRVANFQLTMHCDGTVEDYDAVLIAQKFK
jgi:hypothetical protein